MQLLVSRQKREYAHGYFKSCGSSEVDAYAHSVTDSGLVRCSLSIALFLCNAESISKHISRHRPIFPEILDTLYPKQVC